MPSEQNRVYIENEDEAPNDALIRESDNGNLYYTPSDRGRNNHTGGNKTNELLEQSGPELTPKPDEDESGETEKGEGDTFGKPFEGPEGQGPFDSLEDCADQMEDAVDDPEGWCAWAENKTRKRQQTSKIYVGSEEQAPDDVTVKEDGDGLFYRQQTAWESSDMHYPDDVEDEHEEETDVEMPDAEDADGDDLESEEENEELEEELHEESHEQFDPEVDD